MSTDDRFSEDKDKSFDGNYVCCGQCEWNGVPNQKIVRIYLGIRPANEHDFIYEFEEYDYPIGIRKKLHTHKYDKRIIGGLVGEMLSQTRRCSQ
jgi:hypothetical protein